MVTPPMISSSLKIIVNTAEIPEIVCKLLQFGHVMCALQLLHPPHGKPRTHVMLLGSDAGPAPAAVKTGNITFGGTVLFFFLVRMWWHVHSYK